MVDQVLLILPLQLFDFKQWPLEAKSCNIVYIIEEDHYFTRLPFHKQKLAYQRTCMKHYQLELNKRMPTVKYIDSQHAKKRLYSDLNTKYKGNIMYFDPIDKDVQCLLSKYLKSAQILPTLNYWLNVEELQMFPRKKRYNFNSLYQYQKEKLVSLLERKSDFGINKAKSQDQYNRNKIPKDQVPLKSIQSIQQDDISRESIHYVSHVFKRNYGSTPSTILYPFTRKQALQWLRAFFSQKLCYFGKYQDSIDTDNPFLYHSIISPMLNVGLLTDTIVVNELIKFLYKNKHLNIPIQSIEGFIRQVIGWRNYVYMIYVQEDVDLYKSNYMNHKNKLNDRIWNANTGIIAVDKHLQQLEETAYLSHIPRLMVIGNFMLLLQIDPIQVLDWFSVMFIDSCDCLMVPNIIMSQYNSPIMMTRFYISSFNYIEKMSNEKYPENDKSIWNTLFKAFLLTHQKIGLSSYIYSSTTKSLIQLPISQQNTIKSTARSIIQQLTEKR